MTRSADPMSYAMVVGFVYYSGILLGVLAADDRAVRETRMLCGLPNDPVMTSRWPWHR